MLQPKLCIGCQKCLTPDSGQSEESKVSVILETMKEQLLYDGVDEQVAAGGVPALSPPSSILLIEKHTHTDS